MSVFIRDINENKLFEKCSKCDVISIKCNFHKHKNMSDGFIPSCKFGRKNIM